MKKIILCGGGTGGHTIPACALYEALSKFNKVKMITDIRGEKFLKKEQRIVFPIKRLGFKFFFFSPYLLYLSIKEILKTDVVILFGGYISLFPFVAAWILRRKIIIYQLDAIVTRLNRITIPRADLVLHVFPKVNINNRKHMQLGMPMRQQFRYIYLQHTNKILITIVGGSAGSDYWEILLKDTLKLLSHDEIRKIELMIQSKHNPLFLKKFDIKVTYKEFINTAACFSKSHLIITCAGANTISEISAIGRPAYLYPLQYVIENHQTANAETYKKLSECKIYHPDTYATDLKEYILKIMNDEKYFHYLCKKASTALPKNATNQINKLL